MNKHLAGQLLKNKWLISGVSVFVLFSTFQMLIASWWTGLMGLPVIVAILLSLYMIFWPKPKQYTKTYLILYGVIVVLSVAFCALMVTADGMTVAGYGYVFGGLSGLLSVIAVIEKLNARPYKD